MGDHSPLANEASGILADCEARLEEAVETVRSLQEERDVVIEVRDTARERERRADKELWAWRSLEDSGDATGRDHQRKKAAEREFIEAYRDFG